MQACWYSVMHRLPLTAVWGNTKQSLSWHRCKQSIQTSSMPATRKHSQKFQHNNKSTLRQAVTRTAGCPNKEHAELVDLPGPRGANPHRIARTQVLLSAHPHIVLVHVLLVCAVTLHVGRTRLVQQVRPWHYTNVRSTGGDVERRRLVLATCCKEHWFGIVRADPHVCNLWAITYCSVFRRKRMITC